MDPQQFSQMLASYSPSGAASPYPTDVPSILAAAQPQTYQASSTAAPVAQPAEKKSKGNWFTNALPTIGSVGGGILGAVFGGGIGGVGGAAGGSALGKVIENKLEGNGIGDDVAESALEGGVGQVAGGVAGKVLGKAAQLAKGAAGKIVADDAAKAAIEGRATALKDVSPKLQSAYKANDSLDHVKAMGFDDTDPTKLTHVANTTNDIINDVLNRSLASAGPLDFSHYPQLIKDAIAKESGTLGSYDKIALSRGRLGNANTPASKLLSQLEDLGAGVATPQSDPNALRELTTKLGALADDARPIRAATTGVVDPEQKAVYNVIKGVRDQVKTGLYNRPEVNDILKAETASILPDDVGSQQLADHINNIITQAGRGGKPGAQDLLDELSRNINISKLGQEMQSARQIGSSTGAQARAASEAGVQAPSGNAVNQTADVLGMAGALRHPIAGAGTVITHAAQNPKILETLSRIGALGEKIAPPAGAAVGTLNGALNDGNNDTMGGMMPDQSMMPATAGQPGAQAPGGGLDQSSLLALALYSPSAFSSLIAPSADQQAKVVAANNAETAVNGLVGDTPDQGILSSVMARLGIGEAGAYERKAQNAAQQVAAATGTDAGTVERMLTNYNAGGGNIDEAIRQVLANIESVKRGNTNTAYQSLMNFNGAPVAAR